MRLYDSASAFLDSVSEAVSGCIVSDVRMPGINGIEFLRCLKARQVGIPVIVITGHADMALAVSATKEGAADFIEKPFDDEPFIAAVRAALLRQNDDADRLARD